MHMDQFKHRLWKWTGGGGALLLAAAVTAGAIHAEAAPDGLDPTGIMDCTGLEQLLDYDGEGRLPSGQDPRWNTYPDDQDGVATYSDLPEKYDLRTDHMNTPVPEIRDQGIWGSCWSFGSMASIESNTVVQGGGSANEIDFSELFQIWAARQYTHGEGIQIQSADPYKRLNIGGTTYLTLSDTAAWTGPVDETLAPYQEDWMVSSELLEQTPGIDTVHVQNMDKLPATSVFADWDNHTGYSLDLNAVAAVKNTLMENGIVDVSYYAGYKLPEENGGMDLINPEKFAVYCPVWMQPNHEVSIVGWDDSYSGENFAVTPKEENGQVLNGAWIVRNSWGEGNPDNSPYVVDKDGYFYISYYDQSITEFNSFQVDVPDPEGQYDYDHNYQYDYLGEKSFTYYYPDEDWSGYSVANVFEADGYETLQAVSVTTSAPEIQVELQVYRLDDTAENPQDGEKLLTQTEQISYGGYHTVQLDQEILLDPGEKFAVVQIFPENAAGWVPMEIGCDKPVDMGDYTLSFTASVEKGQSYLWSPDESGTYVWQDLADFSPVDLGNGYAATFGNVMIKAFTSDRTPQSDGTVTVDIVHTNDIHGRSGYEEGSVFGFEKLASYIDEINPDLVVDAGDLYHGQAFATLEEGGSIAKLVHAVGYDLMSPGNHDWNYGKDRLKELGDLSGLEILAGNVTQNGTSYFENDGTFVREVRDEDGDTVKVGVLGVFDPDVKDDTAPSNVEGLDFADDAKSASALAKQLREQGCGIVIAISHQLDCESFLAKTEGIDVLIAGHEHTVTDTEYKDRDGKPVKVVETGAYFANVGNLTLTYDVQKQSIEKAEETTVSAREAANLPSDPEVAKILDEIRAGQEAQLTEVLGATGRDLDGRWEELRIGETGMGRLVTAAYLEETGADVAFENAGGIRIGRILEAGDIMWRDVIDTAPFGNYIVTKQISGQALLEILEQSIETGRQNKLSYDAWKQTGSDVSWPDNSGSYLQFAGIHVQYDMSRPEGERVVLAKVGTEPLNPAKMYTVATNNFVALGEDYSQLKNAPELHQYGACDEALAGFIRKGQEAVDTATGQVWLTETAADGDGSGSGSSDVSENKDTGAQKTNARQEADGGKAVKTGDQQDLTVWGVLILLSGSLAFAFGVYRRKSAGTDSLLH